jgi:hypothetical protein
VPAWDHRRLSEQAAPLHKFLAAAAEASRFMGRDRAIDPAAHRPGLARYLLDIG